MLHGMSCLHGVRLYWCHSCVSQDGMQYAKVLCCLHHVWCLKSQGQASNKGLEIDLLQKRLSAAESNVSTLRTDLAESQQQAAALRAQMQEAEIEAGESQAAAEEQVGFACSMF